MKTWEELVCKAKELAGEAGRKVTDVADLAKQKIKIAENEKAIRATLEALGRLLYDNRHGEGELQEEMVAELVAQIDELATANDDLQAAIDNNSGKKTCLACGKANPADATFCNGCGKNLD